MTAFKHPVARCAVCHRFLWPDDRLTLANGFAFCPECAPRCRRRRVRPVMAPTPPLSPPPPLYESIRFFVGLFAVALGLFGAAAVLTMLWLH